MEQHDYQAMLPEGYSLQKQLATGGFSLTFLARRRGPTGEEDCVIKLLSLQRAQDWKSIELFEREADILKHLRHRGIPRFLDSFTRERDQQNFFFLVQERLPGKSLQEWVDQGRRFSEAEVISIASQLASVLDYLHEINPQVIHRDIKPSNVMLSSEGQVWLIDFGAVRDRILGGENQGSTIVGTFGYMPLEQYEGRAEPASDLYGLGMTLLFVLSGIEPAQMKKKALKTDFREHVSIGSKLAKILDGLIEPDIQRRTASAKVLQRQLRQLNKTGTGSMAHGLHQASQRAQAWFFPFRLKALAQIVLPLGLVGLVVGSLIWLKQKSPDKTQEGIHVDLSDAHEVHDLPPERTALKIMNPQAELDLPAPWRAVPTAAQSVSQIALNSEGLWLKNYSHLFLQHNGQEKSWPLGALMDGQKPSFKQMLAASDVLYLVHEHKKKSALVYRQNQRWQQVKTPNDSPLNALVVRGKTLWAGIDNTLWSFEPEQGKWTKQLTLAKSGASDDIRALSFQGSILWIGLDYELYRWPLGGQAERIGKNKKLIDHLAASQDFVWMADDDGLIRYDVQSQQQPRVLEGVDIQQLLYAEGLWVATEYHGLLSPAEAQNKWLQHSWRQGLTDSKVVGLVAAQGHLWMLMDNKKLYQADRETLRQAMSKHPQYGASELASISYHSACDAVQKELQQPQSGDVGRHTYNATPRAFFQGVQVCPFGYGSMSSTGEVFLHDYQAGFVQSSSDGYLSIPRPDIGQYTSPNALYVDTQGSLWLSTSSDGLWRYTRQKWQRLGPKRYQGYVFAEYQDQVWLGLEQGSEIPKLQYTAQGEGLKGLEIGRAYDRISALLGTPLGLAVGSSGEGPLRLYKEQKWQSWEQKQGLPGYVVTHLAHSSEGLWFSMRQLYGADSLALLQPERQALYIWNERNGLNNTRIAGLAVDDQARIWVKEHSGRVDIYKIADLLQVRAQD